MCDDLRVTLYTNHCPRCVVLENKLNEKGIAFESETDEDVMIAKGFMSAPMLDVDGKVMNFAEAVKWVNEV